MPSAAAAARIASISQWAVGSRSASVRLSARAITSPSRTITQPTGTSPAAAAARASSSAMVMKEGTRLTVMAGLAGRPRALFQVVYKDVYARDKPGMTT